MEAVKTNSMSLNNFSNDTCDFSFVFNAEDVKVLSYGVNYTIESTNFDRLSMYQSVSGDSIEDEYIIPNEYIDTIRKITNQFIEWNEKPNCKVTLYDLISFLRKLGKYSIKSICSTDITCVLEFEENIKPLIMDFDIEIEKISIEGIKL